MSLDATIYVEVDTGGKEPLELEIYRCNITHNLNEMAMEAGIYEELWHPEKIKAEYASKVNGKDGGGCLTVKNWWRLFTGNDGVGF